MRIAKIKAIYAPQSEEKDYFPLLDCSVLSELFSSLRRCNSEGYLGTCGLALPIKLAHSPPPWMLLLRCLSFIRANSNFKEMDVTTFDLCRLAAIGIIFYVGAVSFYRLYWSPLASFPGPKLAAWTQWYEFYWNVIQPGQYIFHLQKLHDEYGMMTLCN